MNQVFACNMNAFSPTERARHLELAHRLRPAVLGFDEVHDGYAARFPSDAGTVVALAEFATLERLCCPFLALAIELEDGNVRLRITGSDGAKPFIRAEFRID